MDSPPYSIYMLFKWSGVPLYVIYMLWSVWPETFNTWSLILTRFPQEIYMLSTDFYKTCKRKKTPLNYFTLHFWWVTCYLHSEAYTILTQRGSIRVVVISSQMMSDFGMGIFFVRFLENINHENQAWSDLNALLCIMVNWCCREAWRYFTKIIWTLKSFL